MSKPRIIHITQREKEIISLLGEGFTIGQVSKQLGLAQHTVSQKSSNVRCLIRSVIRLARREGESHG